MLLQPWKFHKIFNYQRNRSKNIFKYKSTKPTKFDYDEMNKDK